MKATRTFLVKRGIDEYVNVKWETTFQCQRPFFAGLKDEFRRTANVTTHYQGPSSARTRVTYHGHVESVERCTR